MGNQPPTAPHQLPPGPHPQQAQGGPAPVNIGEILQCSFEPPILANSHN